MSFSSDNSSLKTMDKIFKCEICGKHFNAKAHLKQHLNKKYKCTLNAKISNELNNDIVDNENYKNIIDELKKRDEDFSELKKQYKKMENEFNFLVKQHKKISEIVTMTNFIIKNDKSFTNDVVCENN
jgi:DNA repair exonuclease SbcCD ATPase subunit